MLLIEDNVNRFNVFTKWTPPDFRLIWADNANKALGIINRTEPGELAGFLLDHDLHYRQPEGIAATKSGTHVVERLVQLRLTDTPILVHSMNDSRAPLMVNKLEAVGYAVDRIRFADLTQVRYLGWLKGIREEYEA